MPWNGVRRTPLSNISFEKSGGWAYGVGCRDELFGLSERSGREIGVDAVECEDTGRSKDGG